MKRDFYTIAEAALVWALCLAPFITLAACVVAHAVGY